jgi:hypothetical protein
MMPRIKFPHLTGAVPEEIPSFELLSDPDGTDALELLQRHEGLNRPTRDEQRAEAVCPLLRRSSFPL